MRWARGALGRVPRIAQRRVILFFWPIRVICEPDFYLRDQEQFREARVWANETAEYQPWLDIFIPSSVAFV